MNGTARLNLVVLRVTDIDQSAAFYRLLGVVFEEHAHGTGPRHFAAEREGIVFELYPAQADRPASNTTRLGFSVPDLTSVIGRLTAGADDVIVSPPKDSPWGRRAVVKDPDGHRVEIVEHAQA